jgi:ankyrin repeat protein
MGQGEVVKLLIEKGARVNETDRYGFTALQLASIKGNSHIYKLLKKSGAKRRIKSRKKSIKEPGDQGRSTNAFVPAVMRVEEALIEVGLIPGPTRGKENSMENLSIERETMRHLREAAGASISRRDDANLKDEVGNTRLHLAAQKGELDNVNILLEKNPGWVNSKNHFGITPLHYAAAGDFQEVAVRLIAAGANVNAKTHTGITPLYGAVSAGKKETVRLLVYMGARVNTATRDGAYPLHAVTRRDVAELLVSAGARVMSRNKYGFTPLHIAAHYGLIEVAEYLLSRGAKLECRTKVGWTPLCEAVYNGKQEMVAFLAAQGANVNARTMAGATPLGIALNFEENEIIRILRKHGAF